MERRPNSAVHQADSNEEIVSDSITCPPENKTNRQTIPTLYFDGVTCPREEKKEERRPHTSPIHPETKEYTFENALRIIESYARTNNRAYFAQLSPEMQINSLFTYDRFRNTPLAIALFSGMKNAFYEFLQLLSDPIHRVSSSQIERYLNIQNVEGKTSAHLAVLSNDEQILNSLLATNAINFNALDLKLRTIFHYLPQTRIRIPSQLRNNKLAVHALNFHDSEGQTPIHIAIEKQNVPILQAYIAMGGDISIVDRKAKYSPLQYAARAGNPEILSSILSQNHGDIDYQSPDGLTALFLAVSYNHIKVVQMLIANGADPMILRYGNSILSYTQTSGDTNMRTEIFKSLDNDNKWQFLNSRIDWVDNEEEYAWED